MMAWRAVDLPARRIGSIEPKAGHEEFISHFHVLIRKSTGG